MVTTQTINYYFGSGFTVPGTGVMLNDEMDDFSIKPGQPNAFGLIGGEANAIAPGKTPLSSMSPTFVYGRDGKLRLALGAPGGPRIINGVLQTIMHVLDDHEPLADAVFDLRVHHQWQPDELLLEAGFPAETIASLKAKKHVVSNIPEVGRVEAIEILSDGSITAVSDPRGTGAPAAY